MAINFQQQLTAASDSTKDPDARTMEELELIRFNQDTDQRRSLAKWVVIVDSAWLLITAILFILSGNGCLKFSDSVMSVFLGTTTANILGLGFIVLKGLFPLPQEIIAKK